MRRWLILSVLVAALALVGSAWAQATEPTPAPVSWFVILAAAINAVGTMVLVRFVVPGVGWLRANYPDALPVVSGAVGPVLALAQNYLGRLLGVPIELGIPTVMAIFTGGGGALLLSQFLIQRQRRLAHKASLRAAPLAAEHAPI